MEAYKVYVKTTSDGYIDDINSSCFLLDATGWTEIDEGSGDKYHHAQGNYFDKLLRTIYGAYNYKIVNGAIEECTEDEIEEQEDAILSEAYASESESESNLFTTFEVGSTQKTTEQKTNEQMRRATQLFAMTLPEETVLEMPYVFDAWEAGKSYAVGEYLTYGLDNAGDPRLYKVIKAHTSQADSTPDISTELYSAVGLV